jgi:hypothetical protein
MAAPGDQSPRPEGDPEAVSRALELELISRRAGWQKAKERRQTWRALSILFFLLIVLVALVAYFYLVPELSRERKSSAPASQTDQ